MYHTISIIKTIGISCFKGILLVKCNMNELRLSNAILNKILFGVVLFFAGFFWWFLVVFLVGGCCVGFCFGFFLICECTCYFQFAQLAVPLVFN